RLCEKAQADVPLLVERNSAEAGGRECVELGPGLGGRIELGQHVDEHTAPDRIGGMLRRRSADKCLYLIEATLFPPKKIQLQSVRDCRVPGLSPLPDCTGLRDQPLGLSEASFEQCQQGS